MQILSVDLAHTSYGSLGIVGLEEKRTHVKVRRFAPSEFRLTGPPSPEDLAEKVTAACKRLGVEILFLDGPQGWKDPNNGLTHSRVCERTLNTPGKTGLPGVTKPLNYLAFITFSVAVFQSLFTSGFRPFSGGHGRRLAVESFPLSAWKQLRLLPLPAKSRAKSSDLIRATADLRRLFAIEVPDGLSHDELQALVAAVAGVPLVRRAKTGYATAGIAPSVIDGSWREGFILNPTPEALVALARPSNNQVQRKPKARDR